MTFRASFPHEELRVLLLLFLYFYFFTGSQQRTEVDLSKKTSFRIPLTFVTSKNTTMEVPETPRLYTFMGAEVFPVISTPHIQFCSGAGLSNATVCKIDDTG